MNAAANGQAVLAAVRELKARWEETRSGWSDAKAREFEERFLNELIAASERAMPVFDQIEKLLTKAREDCE